MLLLVLISDGLGGEGTITTDFQRQAEGYILTELGGVPVDGDTITVTWLNSNDDVSGRTDHVDLGVTQANSGLYNAGTSSWTGFTQVIDGDLLVQGTVVADRLILDGATLRGTADGALQVGRIQAENLDVDSVTAGAIAADAVNAVNINLTGALEIRTDSAGSLLWGLESAFDVTNDGLFLGNATNKPGDIRFVVGYYRELHLL